MYYTTYITYNPDAHLWGVKSNGTKYYVRVLKCRLWDRFNGFNTFLVLLSDQLTVYKFDL